APVADGLGEAGDERADAGLTVWSSHLTVQILARDDVGRGHGPGRGDLDVLLLEDDLALEVLNDGVAELPGELVEGRDARPGEVALESEAGGGLRTGVAGDVLGGGGGGGGGVGNDVGH